MSNNRITSIVIYLAIAAILRFFVVDVLSETYPPYIRLLGIAVIMLAGILFVLRATTRTIEETTEVLSERTKLAGGLLQSIGTAFPDMILGIVAALISFRVRNTDYALAVNYAIIAAATTFGSNIFNIGHAAWCIFRQNLANQRNTAIAMFPLLPAGGILTPMSQHAIKPSLGEVDTAIDVSTALTILTAAVALGMVLFGQVHAIPTGFTGDLYRLTQPLGILLLLAGAGVMFHFRKNRRPESPIVEIDAEESYYRGKKLAVIFFHLILAGLAIFLTAEVMVRSIEVFSVLTGIPFVITGVLAGIIGCLGEILVVHNFSVHPKGRIGDAIVGVAMDNIVTIIGASIVAIIGGIFLGGNSLILIFVVIFAANAILVSQISRLKTTLVHEKHT